MVMADVEEVIAVINQLRKDAEAKVPHPWPKTWPDDQHTSAKGIGYGQVVGLPAKHPWPMPVNVTDRMRFDLDDIAHELNINRSTLVRQWLQDAIDEWYRVKGR